MGRDIEAGRARRVGAISSRLGVVTFFHERVRSIGLRSNFESRSPDDRPTTEICLARDEIAPRARMPLVSKIKC